LARTPSLQQIPTDAAWVPKQVGDFIRENCFALKCPFFGKLID